MKTSAKAPIIAGAAALFLSLGACASGQADETTPPSQPTAEAQSPTDGSTSAQSSGSQSQEELSPESVAGTYTDGEWVIRLMADGTWEEDIGGQKNAYGGNFEIQGNEIILEDSGGTSETAVLDGNELRLPSVTLTKEN